MVTGNSIYPIKRKCRLCRKIENSLLDGRTVWAEPDSSYYQTKAGSDAFR